MNKFIHKASVIYLALIVLVRIMAMPISLIDYTINKSFIANNICENRFRPEMHCAGKCFLNKQLAKTNENQGSRDQKVSFKNLVIDYFEPLNRLSFGSLTKDPVFGRQFKTSSIPSSFADNIFHPPIA
jgi:hypothetical protein